MLYASPRLQYRSMHRMNMCVARSSRYFKILSIPAADQDLLGHARLMRIHRPRHYISGGESPP